MPRSARAALVLITAAGLSLTGCGLTTPITTQQPYAPSDGVRVALSPDVRVENLMVLTQDEDGEAVLIGMLVNDHRTEPVTLSLTDEQGTELVSAEVDAHGVDNLNDSPVAFPAADAVPGSTVPVTVDAEGIGAETAAVPVLDGTLEEYAQYLDALPAAEPSADASASPSAGASASADASPSATPSPSASATNG